MSLPPLVEPAPNLSIEEVRRYSRHLIIPDVGMDGQTRLKNAKVLAAVKNAGFKDAVHVQGGVTAWATRIDKTLPTY